MKLIIRLLAFFGKELNEIRRQPRLLLSLLVGPFLILLLFGLGYRGTPPPLRVGLVVPDELSDDARVQRVREVLELNFDLVYAGSDLDTAMQLLENEQLDVVEVLPGNYQKLLSSGQRAPFTFIYNEINPQQEQYLQYSAYTQIDAINQVFAVESVQQLQQNADSVSQQLDEARAALDALEQNPLAGEEDEDVGRDIGEMSRTLAILAASPALAAVAMTDDELEPGMSQDLMQLSEDLADLEQAIGEGEVEGREQQIAELRQRIDELDKDITQVSAMPANVFVAPLEQQNENLQGEALDLMQFFAPGVAVLILQHIAVTLGALSLVRERYRGAFEFFSVAPVSMLQVILGKYLAYLLYVGLITAALVGLMVVPLQVPFLGNPWVFAGLTALFLVASIGVGFVISTISNSDTQAVQLAMLMLLLSIFFSGFILPLDNFTVPVRYVGFIAPMTHAMVGFQDIMLGGDLPGQFEWIALAVLAVLAFALVLLFGYRRFRQPV